jgi:chromosomal replication initiator protein
MAYNKDAALSLLNEAETRHNSMTKILELLSMELGLSRDEIFKMNIKAVTILSVIKDYFQLDINIKTRKREYMVAREVACYMLKKYSRLTLREIAEHCGITDHSTSLHHINKVTSYLENDQEYKEMVDKLERKLLNCL